MTDTRQRVAMGYIKGVFGIKGWLKIAANTEYADSLLDYPEWQLSKDGKTLNVTLEAGKIVSGELQVKFEGIDDRDQAFALRGYKAFGAGKDFRGSGTEAEQDLGAGKNLRTCKNLGKTEAFTRTAKQS